MRGLQTLYSRRRMLNPVRYGLFAWMLASHKLCRWLIPWAGVCAVGSLVVLAFHQKWAAALLLLAILSVAMGTLGWVWSRRYPAPRILALPTFALLGNIAVLHAWIKAMTVGGTSTWEPTRRGVAERHAGRQGG